jgi:peroxiredoxin/predicted nucleic acid-binding Zn ribbon protein
MSALCPYCSTSLRPDARFCSRCGRAVASAAAPTRAANPCPACGYANRSGAKFCAHCRSALTLAVARRRSAPLWLIAGVMLIGAIGGLLLLILPRADPGQAAAATSIAPATPPATRVMPAGVPETPTPDARVGTQAGERAPDFALSDLAGDTVRLSDWRGQVVIVNFWATWCGFCEREMPDLQAVYADYQARGVVVLALDQAEGRDEARRFRDKHGLTFPILLDDDKAVGNQYRASGLPMTYVIDRAGIVRAVLAGQQTRQQFIDQMEPWL